MATSQISENISLVAGEALTVNRFVTVDANGEALMADDALGLVGVCQEEVAIGVVAPIMSKHGAVVPIELGGTLAAGAEVMSGTDGVAVAEATAGSIGAGTLLEGGVSGDVVSMIFNPIRRHAA